MSAKYIIYLSGYHNVYCQIMYLHEQKHTHKIERQSHLSFSDLHPKLTFEREFFSEQVLIKKKEKKKKN